MWMCTCITKLNTTASYSWSPQSSNGCSLKYIINNKLEIHTYTYGIPPPSYLYSGFLHCRPRLAVPHTYIAPGRSSSRRQCIGHRNRLCSGRLEIKAIRRICIVAQMKGFLSKHHWYPYNIIQSWARLIRRWNSQPWLYIKMTSR